MILCAVNGTALLSSLCVLCGLLAAGVAMMSALIAKSNRYNANLMKKDVYTREIIALTGDSVEIHDNNADKNDITNSKIDEDDNKTEIDKG